MARPSARAQWSEVLAIEHEDLFLVYIVVAGVSAPLNAWLASRRSRSPAIWFVFGALIGPIALALLAFAPPGRCPSCDASIPGWSVSCPQCDTHLPGIAALLSGPRIQPVTKFANVPDVGQSAELKAIPDLRTHRSSRRRATFQPLTMDLVPDRAVAAEYAQSASSVGEVLATGIYLSGNAGLEIGACYALARIPGPDGDRLRVFGPVDTGQITIRHEGPLGDFEITLVEGQVIISGRDRRSSLHIVFRAIGGMGADGLERALGPGPIDRR